MLRILIEDSEGKSKHAPISLDTGEITIGRKEGNIIRLKERNVSRNHARIYTTPDGLFIEPVAARYGLKLNSAKITGPTPLALGDEIRIGDFRLYLQDESAPEVPKNDAGDVVSDIDPTLQPRFVVISSNFAGVEYHVQRSKITIGRNPECDIAIHHQSVSGNHAEVRRTARGDYEIRDNNSSNGTKVNGIPISEPFKLCSGDAVTLGHVTMRYCGPGDFWSLNFGINDEPKRTNPLVYILATLVVVLLIIVVLVAVLRINPAEQPNNAPVAAVDDSAAKEAEFMTNYSNCLENINKGQLENAEIYCNKASKILTTDNRIVELKNRLDDEKIAKTNLEDAKASLSDNKCREALSLFENIRKGTWAANQMNEGDLKNKARDCVEKTLLKSAQDAIADGNIGDAELYRDEIKKIRSDSSNINAIDEEIQKYKNASKNSNSGSKAPKVANNNNAEAAPKAAAPAVDAEDLCTQAVKAKIAKDNCKAYNLYKKVKKVGYPNDTCKRNGESTITAYAGQCN